jgi:hypothetical protein
MAAVAMEPESMEVTADLRQVARKAALASLWLRRKVWPLLEVYLDRDQLEDIRRFMEGGDADRGVLPSADWYDDISRQRGKSYKWTVFDVVWCHCHSGQQLKYLAQTGVSVRGIIIPVIQQLLEDMPPEFRPRHDGPEAIHEDKQDHKWHFPHPGKTPSTFHATGANNQHYKALRGPKAHKITQDECGFYDDFEEVQSALRPMLITTGGPCVYATTPAESPAHPSESTCQGLKAQGRYVHRTIYSHPRLSAEAVEAVLLKEAARKGLSLEQFKRSSYYRREYLSMHIVESTRAVCPEWSEDGPVGLPEGSTWGDAHTVELPRPQFCDWYDSLDIGFTRDPSAWLGAYWDWSNARLVVEAESPPMRQFRAEMVGELILAKRRELWPASGAPPTPVGLRRSPCGTYWMPHHSVGDGSGNGAEKLRELHEHDAGVSFAHAAKPDLESRVNAVRTLVAQGKLWVHPRCTNLQKQLATGLWADKLKTDFERTEEGHLDFFAALVDLVHAIDRQQCPIPNDFGRTQDHERWIPVGGGNPATVRELDKALGGIQW